MNCTVFIRKPGIHEIDAFMVSWLPYKIISKTLSQGEMESKRC
jgi:hypothetical protein